MVKLEPIRWLTVYIVGDSMKVKATARRLLIFAMGFLSSGRIGMLSVHIAY